MVAQRAHSSILFNILGREGMLMVRAVLLILVALGLLCGAVMNDEIKGLMVLAGIAGTCMGLSWLTERGR